MIDPVPRKLFANPLIQFSPPIFVAGNTQGGALLDPRPERIHPSPSRGVPLISSRVGRTGCSPPSRGLDSFDQYLQDVEKYPLIQDPEEERALARRARTGDKEAAERLVTANLRFRHLLCEEVSGAGPGPRGAGLHRKRGPPEGGEEVRSRQGGQVHLLRGLVDPPDGAAGAGRAERVRCAFP